ncbi:MAG TPA: NusG domain II-containing protein [Clostridia bacterium]|nr:NusG domain II-containing protein [Clostridia bacterium]
MKRLFKRADFVLIFVFSLLFAAMFLPRVMTSDNLTAKIYKNGNEIYSINLNTVTSSYVIDLESKPPGLVQVQKNAIGYVDAGCADKLCVNAGMLTRRGQTAACLPAKTVIILTGGKKNEDTPDVITY